jgi:hypothetical protein
MSRSYSKAFFRLEKAAAARLSVLCVPPEGGRAAAAAVAVAIVYVLE